MLVGNLAAIAQSSIRRLLAYSAIGHAGYMLLGILSSDAAGLESLIYYVITYALATIGVFGILAALEKEGVDRLTDLAGMSDRAPWLSFCMLIFILSLAGIPPLAGFFGKFYVFSSAFFSRPELLWLVVLAISMSVVSLYYYLKVLKQIYVLEPAVRERKIDTPLVVRIAVGLTAVLVVAMGVCPDLLIDWIGAAVRLVPH
jgi:NADH-quinone oxidoreductase subunit N